MKILYTWTGYRELKEAEKECPDFEELCEKHIKSFAYTPTGSSKVTKGWVRSALKEYKFNKMVILVDYTDEQSLVAGNNFREAYKKTFSEYMVEVQMMPVVIPDKNDYTVVYQETKTVLVKTSHPGDEKYFLLVSGTYAMNVCWILLGKTLFEEGAHFLRNCASELKSFDIPLDLTVEYIPKRLSSQSSYIHHFYDGFEGIVGNSPLLKKAINVAHKAALYDVTVLLVGETGTGKEKFADAIQKASPRKNGPYLKINCAAIPASLLEDTLFGHVKGAFTGAKTNEPGLLKKADGGTLFLDEVGECPPEMQAKLLRVLQPPDETPTIREYYRVGSKIPERSDVRIIAATNRDLGAMSKKEKGEAGSFRSDLLFRLSSIVINLPPLRERMEDVIPTAKILLDAVNKRFSSVSPGYKEKKFSPKTIKFIQKYDWPGNVRELSYAILSGATLSEGGTILPEDLGIITQPAKSTSDDMPPQPEGGIGIDINNHLRQELKKWVEKAIESTDSKRAAADWLHLANPQALDSKLKTLGTSYQDEARKITQSEAQKP